MGRYSSRPTLRERQYMRNQRKDYFYRDGEKLGADGTPYRGDDKTQSDLLRPSDPTHQPGVGGGGHENAPGTGKTHLTAGGYTANETEGEDDDNLMTLDDEGRMPDEPGYGKGPDWKPPFQTSGGETDMPTDAEIAFMMDDANYGIGGDLNTTNTDTGANIETFELGLGYGNVGGWTPTKRENTGSKGSSITSSMSPASKPGNTRRDIRARKTLISGAR